MLPRRPNRVLGEGVAVAMGYNRSIALVRIQIWARFVDGASKVTWL